MYGYQPGNLKGRMGHELVFFKDQRFSKSGENFTDLVFLKICYYHYLLLRVYSLYSFPLEGQGRDVIGGCFYLAAVETSRWSFRSWTLFLMSAWTENLWMTVE